MAVVVDREVVVHKGREELVVVAQEQIQIQAHLPSVEAQIPVVVVEALVVEDLAQ